MNDIKEAKTNVLKMLDGPVDQALLELGFKRRKGSLVYKKKLLESIQEIEFVTDYFPRYEDGAEAHIHPVFVWKIPSVSEEALKLVSGNKMLLANAPDILLKQPIEICAPKENHERWFTKGEEDYPKVGIAICSFIEKWLVDLLESMQGIDDLLKAYESSNAFLLKQQHWYVFVTAAYMLRGAPEKAKLVMEEHLGNPGLRKRYSAVYDNL
ncbi:hypothetical protein [Pseudoalteromonas phenolica]|uniref:hypothetical protein n=1 Tax=Pseudoalteromonas phenolica TaxID=161398 RepID=UPI00384A77CF